MSQSETEGIKGNSVMQYSLPDKIAGEKRLNEVRRGNASAHGGWMEYDMIAAKGGRRYANSTTADSGCCRPRKSNQEGHEETGGF